MANVRRLQLMAKEKGLVPAPRGVDWGTTNTPVERRIDPSTKRYRTRAGHEVRGLRIVLHNSCGREVTCPVKGSVDVRSQTGMDRARWIGAIWTLDGRHNLFERSDLDLVEVDEQGEPR